MIQKDEIAMRYYINKSQIARLLGISREQARVIYDEAEKRDAERFKDFRPEPSKVRTRTVCSVYGINYEEVQKRANLNNASSKVRPDTK